MSTGCNQYKHTPGCGHPGAGGGPAESAVALAVPDTDEHTCNDVNPTPTEECPGCRAEGQPDDSLPRLPDGSIDTAAAIEQGLVDGFSTTTWPEPRTLTLVGHWDDDTLVIESVYDGEVVDDREDTGYWSEGLWASSGTGLSEAEIAAGMIDEYHECRRIRMAMDEDDYTPEETCQADECDESLEDNEGYDGLCGHHADLVEAHERGEHEDDPDDDCPECD